MVGVDTEWVDELEFAELDALVQQAERVRSGTSQSCRQDTDSTLSSNCGRDPVPAGAAPARDAGAHYSVPRALAFTPVLPSESAAVQAPSPAGSSRGTALPLSRSDQAQEPRVQQLQVQNSRGTVGVPYKPPPRPSLTAAPAAHVQGIAFSAPPSATSSQLPAPAAFPSTASSSKATTQASSSKPSLPLRASGRGEKAAYAPLPSDVRVMLQLAERGVVGVTMRFRDDAVLQAVRQVSGHQWNAALRTWEVPVQHFDDVLSKVRAVVGQSAVRIPPPMARAVLVPSERGAPPLSRQSREEAEAQWECADRIPDILRTQLMPFQREGVLYALERSGRALIGDEMGLGKTVQGIAVAACYFEDWPVLVLCPSSLRMAWKMEFLRWLPWLDPHQVHVIMAGRDRVTGPVCIISYDLAARCTKDLDNLAPGVVIADESHYLKNRKAKRTQVCVPILQRARRALLLTGTPALSRPVELYTQLNALHPRIFSRFADFGDRYCGGRHPGAVRFKDYVGATCLGELHLLLRESGMIRRRKADVLTQLPSKRRAQIFLAVSSSSAVSMQKMRERLDQIAAERDGAADDESLEKLENAQRAQVMELFRATAVAKRTAVMEYITDFLDGGPDKFLVFAHHHDIIDGVASALTKAKARHVVIDGRTPATERMKLVTQFQNDPGLRVAVLGLTAAGTGLTLHAASDCVFAELHWTPGILAQAEARVHRIGQTNSCMMYYLLARETADDFLWPMIQEKLSVVGNALDGKSEGMAVVPKGAAVAAAQARARTSRVQPLQFEPVGAPTEATESGTRKQQTIETFLSKRPRVDPSQEPSIMPSSDLDEAFRY